MPHGDAGYRRVEHPTRERHEDMLIMAANGFTDGLDRAWANTAEFIPKFIGFLVMLFIGYIVAKAVAKIVDAVLERVGFDRAVERGGIKRALANSNYDASSLMGKVIFYTVFLLALQMA